MHVLCLDLSINDKSLCRPGMLHRTFPYIFSVCVNAVKSEIKAKTQIFYLSVNLFLPSASVVKSHFANKIGFTQLATPLKRTW